jgi:uncharacterized protein YpmB
MNIKVLKFIVIFLGILIILGFITLSIGIYHKLNNFSSNNAEPDTIIIKKLNNLDIEDFYITQDQIIVKYSNENKKVLYVYDIITGKNIKKIELLK